MGKNGLRTEIDAGKKEHLIFRLQNAALLLIGMACGVIFCIHYPSLDCFCFVLCSIFFIWQRIIYTYFVSVIARHNGVIQYILISLIFTVLMCFTALLIILIAINETDTGVRILLTAVLAIYALLYGFL